MSSALPTTLDQDEILVAELRRLGVRHLARLTVAPPAEPMQPEELLRALARHEQARFQAALIPLFLRRPEFGAHVSGALEKLPRPAADTLRLYYQAAVYLQRELEPELKERLENWSALPDLYSAALGLPSARSIRPAPEGASSALAALGEVHRGLSGWNYNWAGSYRQTIPLFLKYLPPARGHHNA